MFIQASEEEDQDTKMTRVQRLLLTHPPVTCEVHHHKSLPCLCQLTLKLFVTSDGPQTSLGLRLLGASLLLTSPPSLFSHSLLFTLLPPFSYSLLPLYCSESPLLLVTWEKWRGRGRTRPLQCQDLSGYQDCVVVYVVWVCWWRVRNKNIQTAGTHSLAITPSQHPLTVPTPVH